MDVHELITKRQIFFCDSEGTIKNLGLGHNNLLGVRHMENEELKEKMVKIIINAIWKDAEADYDSTDETEAGSIADALIEAGYGDGVRMSYQRLTKLSDLGTLHALDFNGEEQPLCELTALDTDALIRRLYELENKIESGELVEAPKGSVVLILEERANEIRQEVEK